MAFKINFARAFDRQYLYSLLVVSAVCAKLFHLWTHVTSLPILLYILYFPTFLIQDYLVIILGRLILHQRRGKIYWAVGGLVSFITLFASAASFAFYLETGGEIHWNMTKRVGQNIDGFAKLLLSALKAFIVASIVMIGLAAFVTPWLYNKVGIWLATAWNLLVPQRFRITTCHNGTEFIELRASSPSLLGETESSTEGDDEESRFSFESESEDSEDEIRMLKSQIRRRGSRFNWSLWVSRVKLLFPIITIIVLRSVRKPAPYEHMSNTLPFTLLDVFAPERSDFCDAGGSNGVSFPFPELINRTLWETPGTDGFGTGWMPGIDEYALWKMHNGQVPDWLPQETQLKGFEKWYGRTAPQPKKSVEDSDSEIGTELDGSTDDDSSEMSYNPVTDPLRISNMDSEIFPELVKAFSNKDKPVKIKHVILLSLESTRKDVFPLKNDSHLMEMIIESHKDSKDYDEAQLKRLNGLTKNAELLTGEGPEQQTMGGINVVGATTGATFTLKSLLGSHCGVSPLAVDFLEEVESPIYQPCLPQILNLLNNNKTAKLDEEESKQRAAEDWKSRPWESIYLQAVTAKFDRQKEVLQHIGFSRKITREDLQSPSAPHKLTEPESNYFGYPESTLKPYLKDILLNAEKKNKRMFISHLTSSTHHPWALPQSSGPPKKFMGGWKHESMNKYINTVGYCDDWLGQILELLEETGLRDETLIVAVGDHGFAFAEDDKKTTCYENGHITNFKVPLVFHHPQIPRVQLNIPATSISILPTVLDLLVNTNSLNEQDRYIARHISNEYEGQSLIRPFVPKKNGRQQWNFGVINPGGTHLSVASATSHFRLIMPVCESAPYRITNLDEDPNEKDALEVYGLTETLAAVKKRWGEEAESWVHDAEAAGGWWIREGRRRWAYTGAPRKDDRGAAHNDDGKLFKDHWWET